MQTWLKRAEQAQPSSPTRSCRCNSREWEEADPVARSRALCAEFSDATFGGPGSKEGMGEGLAAEGPLRAAAALGLPAPGIRRSQCRAAPPARPRRSDHGLFLWGAGLESGPCRLRRRSGKLRAPTASDRRTRATTQAPHPPARSPAQRSRPPLTATGSSEGSAPAAAAGREGARA